MNTIDMEYIRYLNLFEKITGVSTQYCFPYNNQLLFVVKPGLISKAIGENGKNVKKISSITKKRIKIVPEPKDDTQIEIKKFIGNVIEPRKFRNLKINGSGEGREIILNADRRNKAALIGKGKKRKEELSDITESFFGMNVRIV